MSNRSSSRRRRAEKLQTIEKKIEQLQTAQRQAQFDLWAALLDAEDTGEWKAYGENFGDYLQGRWNFTKKQVEAYQRYKEISGHLGKGPVAELAGPNLVTELVGIGRVQKNPGEFYRAVAPIARGEVAMFENQNGRIPSAAQQRRIAREVASGAGYTAPSKKARSRQRSRTNGSRLVETLRAIAIACPDPHTREVARDALKAEGYDVGEQPRSRPQESAHVQ